MMKLARELGEFFKAVASPEGLKALGFPVWNTLGPWPGGPGNYIGLDSLGLDPLQLATVYGCARVLAQGIASPPWQIFREDALGNRTKAVDHPTYVLLHDSPNAYMSSFEFRQALMLAYCLYGNAYTEVRTLGKRVVSLNPLRADRMRPMFLPPEYNTLVYRYSHLNGKTEDYSPEQIVHVKNFSLDGLVGISPVRRYVMEHAHAAQNYGRNFFRNQGRPSGVLSSDQNPPTNEEASKKMRAEWDAVFSGPENAGKTAVLWKNLKYQAISLPPDDMQYIETRKLSTEEICGGIYGVPANLIGHTDKTATHASAEQFDLQFVKYVLGPLSEMFEQAFNRRLFATEPGVYSEMNLDSFLRGDAASQATYFSVMTQNGIMSRNEARRKLNLPEVDGADELTVQSNLIDLDKLASVTNRNQLSPTAPVKSATMTEEKQAPAFEMHVDKLEQTVLPAKPLKKLIRLHRDKEARVDYAEVQEIVQ